MASKMMRELVVGQLRQQAEPTTQMLPGWGVGVWWWCCHHCCFHTRVY